MEKTSHKAESILIAKPTTHERTSDDESIAHSLMCFWLDIGPVVMLFLTRGVGAGCGEEEEEE